MPAPQGGHRTVIGCRATRSYTDKTFVLLQRSSSTSRYRRAADHQVREAACTDAVVSTTLLLRLATRPEFSRTVRGAEERMKLRRQFWVNYSYCCRKTCSALRNGAKQRLAAGAHRAVVNGPSIFYSIPTFGDQATAAGQLMKSPCGLPRFTISRQYA